jgi:hypothetical protein
MNAHLRLAVRRLDGRWHVTASDSELEHTHRHPFPTRDAAQRFVERVRQALEDGRDLDLRHWEYTGP